jgi:hypothetical protein
MSFLVCLHLVSILLFPSFYGPRWIIDSDELVEEEGADGTCHSSTSTSSGTGHAISRAPGSASHKSYMTLPTCSSSTPADSQRSEPVIGIGSTLRPTSPLTAAAEGDIELNSSSTASQPPQSYHLADDSLVSTDPSTLAPEFISFYDRHVPLKETVTMWRCYALMVAFMCITGSGLLVINNIQAIVQALHQEASPLFVTILSLANACGRLAVGVVGDYFHRSISRLQLLAIIALLMALSQYLLSLGSTSLLYPCLLLVGFMFGACFSNIAAVTADIFGSQFIGSNYGFIDLAPAAGAYVFSTALIALFYRATPDSSDSSSNSGTCYGATCFQTPFQITSLCCFLSCGLALWTHHHTKILKKGH